MNTMDIRLQQAIAAARAGKRDEALILTENYLQDDPENVHAVFLKSTLVTSKEDKVASLRDVLALDPDHKGAQILLDRLGEPVHEEAEIVVEPAFEPEPEEVEAEAVVITEADLPAEEEAGFEEDVPSQEIAGAAFEASPDQFMEELIEEEEGPFEEETPVPVLEETLISYPEEQPMGEDEVLPSLSEEEEVPDWLMEESGLGDEATIVSAGVTEDEKMPIEMGELPDWLQEEPTEEWLSQEHLAPAESDIEIQDEFAAEFTDEADIAAADHIVEETGMTPEPAPTKKAKKRSNRVLEILLVFLIILAVAVIAGLVFVLVS